VSSFLDPEFRNHARAARMAVRLATLLADDRVPVNGLRGWLRQAVRAAEALPAATDAERIARLELVNAALKAALAAEEAAAPAADPAWRFGRLFLYPLEPGAAVEHSRLWKSAGYGSEWFLDRADGWLRSRAALLELAQSLRGS
jgi:hypothetical protein